MTTIRPKTSRKVYHNRFEGDLARCSVYDLSNNRIVSDESVINNGSYQLVYYEGTYIPDVAIPMRETTISLSREMTTLKEGFRRLESNVATLNSKLDKINPEEFPRFYVWRSKRISSENHSPLIFNEIKYNDGEMYDVQSGKATVEYDGVYIFSTSLYKCAGSSQVSFYIYVNDEAYAESTT